MVGPVGFEPTLVRLKGECFAHLASDPNWWLRLDLNQHRAVLQTAALHWSY
jgi:hypothetical protein